MSEQGLKILDAWKSATPEQTSKETELLKAIDYSSKEMNNWFTATAPQLERKLNKISNYVKKEDKRKFNTHL